MSWVLVLWLAGPAETQRIERIPTTVECERVRRFMTERWARVRKSMCMPQPEIRR